jgi:hypothetical protein
MKLHPSRRADVCTKTEAGRSDRHNGGARRGIKVCTKSEGRSFDPLNSGVVHEINLCRHLHSVRCPVWTEFVQTSAPATMSVNCGGHGFGHEPTRDWESVRYLTLLGFPVALAKPLPCP